MSDRKKINAKNVDKTVFYPFILVLLLTIIANQQTLGQNSSETGSLEPLSKEFAEFMQKAPKMNDSLGYIPSPASFYSDIRSLNNESLTSLPSVYDLRTAGPGNTSYMTPVRDQGSCGSCWTFAALGSIESYWKMQGMGEYDLSENNLKNCHGFNWGHCYGGNADMSIAYLSRYSGPVNESSDPYSSTLNTCNQGLQQPAYVTDMRYIPNDINTIKQALMDNGALHASFYWDAAYYNSGDFTFYYNGSASSNHAIIIAGWDDNRQTSGGTGAWLIKNSWGNTWGSAGYFYISYNDSKINTNVAFFPGSKNATTASTLYHIDHLGSTGGYGYWSTVGYGLIKYNATGNQELKSIGTYVKASNSSISFELYSTFSGGNLSGLIGSIPSQLCEYPGYYTFALPSAVIVNQSQAFYIKVRYETPDWFYPIPVERAISGYASPTIESNMCWLSSSGSNGAWTLIGGGTANLYDLCIKVYAEANPIAGTKTIGSSGDFQSIAAAVHALNNNGVGQGGVIFDIAAGHTETAPAGGILLGSSLLNASVSAANTILFRKTGIGANPIITAPTGTSTTFDGIFLIQGTDYVTIDGINLSESAGNTTATTRMEWGFALLKRQSSSPFDGCQYVTIRNCSISLNKANTNSVGIYSGNHTAGSLTALTITYPSDALSNCRFYGNTITNCYIGISLNGFTDSSPFTLCDDGNQVGVDAGNAVSSFGGSSLATYGIYCLGQNNLQIAGNQINGASQTGTVYGIYVSESGETQMHSNHIYNIASTASTGLAYGIYASAQSSTIHNNFISDLKTPAATTDAAVQGIRVGISNQTGIYFNTIYLNASSTSKNAFGSIGLYIESAITIADIRNNIIINNSIPGSKTGNTVAFRYASSNHNNFSTLSNNNCFYTGTSTTRRFLFMDGTNACQNIQTYQTLVSPRESASFSELPPFTNIASTPFNLRLAAGTATLCESGGQSIASINHDIDGNVRYGFTGYSGNGIAPDLGASEGNFTLLDIKGPAIQFEPIANTSYFTNRTLSATIFDPSGVAISGNALPMLYWKKTNQASFTGVQALYVAGNEYRFEFGANTGLADTVHYFIVNQDMASPPNISVYPSEGSSGLTYNPPAATVPPTNPQYYIILPEISGTYTIGSSQPANYPTLTAAIRDYNNRVMSGPVEFILVDASYNIDEIYPIVIRRNQGASAVNTLTIKPANGNHATIAGNINGGILEIEDAAYIVIDGSDSITGNRNLTIINSNTSGNMAGIKLIGEDSVLSDISIKSCNISSGHRTPGSYGIHTGGSFGFGGNDIRNIEISNNSITNVYSGVYCSGTPLSRLTNLKIITTCFGGDDPDDYISMHALHIAHTDTCLIEGNTISGVQSDMQASPVAIEIDSGTTNTSILRNRISSIHYTGTGGYGARGISIRKGEIQAKIVIANNAIMQVSADGGSQSDFFEKNIFGIAVNGGSNYSILYNSVSLTGARKQGSGTAPVSAAVFVSSNASEIRLANNVFYNIMTSEDIGDEGKNVAVWSEAPATAFSLINYNCYYVNSANLQVQKIVGFLGGLRTSIVDWRQAVGNDQFSIEAHPGFTSADNLQPDIYSPNCFNINGMGLPLDETGFDINSNTRSTAIVTGTTDMGAFEFTPSATPNIVPQIGTIANDSTTTYILNGRTLASIMWFGTDFPNISMRYFSGVAPENAPPGSNYGNVHWKISPSGGIPGNWSYRMIFYYDPATIGTIPCETQIMLAKRQDAASAWTFISSEINTTQKTITTMPLYSFSEFGMFELENQLPVELTAFTANCIENGVTLMWTTQSETQCESFGVYHSTDGKDFILKETIAGNGTTSAQHNYSVNIFTKNSGISYFQLVQKDFNGDTHKSEIIAIDCNSQMVSDPSILTWQEDDRLYVQFSSSHEEAYNLQINDLTGRVIYSTSSRANTGTNLIILPRTPAGGIYLISLAINGKWYHKKTFVACPK